MPVITDAHFVFLVFVGDDCTRTHLSTCTVRRRNGDHGGHVVDNQARTFVIQNAARIGCQNTGCLGRVHSASTTDSQEAVTTFRTIHGNALVHSRDTWIRNHTVE